MARPSVPGRTRVILVVWFVVAAACAGGDPSSAVPVPVTVVEVIDGDSLVVRTANGEMEVRLVGVNAPEHDECFGPQARRILEEAVSGPVRLDQVGTDRFGRTLARLTVAGGDVGDELVGAGAALALSGDGDYARRLIASERDAREARRGLWSPAGCDASAPPIADVVDISDIRPDPPGPDEDRLEDEWVELTARASVDLGGWVLRDESSRHRFRFPDGFVLAAGERLRIVSGCRPPPGALAWCAQGPVWNNDGDSVLLVDRWGRVVAHRRYDPG